MDVTNLACNSTASQASCRGIKSFSDHAIEVEVMTTTDLPTFVLINPYMTLNYTALESMKIIGRIGGKDSMKFTTLKGMFRDYKLLNSGQS